MPKLDQPFWDFYLAEHQDARNQWVHVIGSLLALAWIVSAVVLAAPGLLIGAAVTGYGAAWAGHFFFEKNRPATFRFPIRSFLADWRLMALVLTRRINR